MNSAGHGGSGCSEPSRDETERSPVARQMTNPESASRNPDSRSDRYPIETKCLSAAQRSVAATPISPDLRFSATPPGVLTSK